MRGIDRGFWLKIIWRETPLWLICREIPRFYYEKMEQRGNRSS